MIAEDSSDVIQILFPSSTRVIINLVNNNDEYPQFLNAPYNVVIQEHSNNGTLIVMVIHVIELLNVFSVILMQLNVTDRDIGPGGMVIVNITSHEDVFEIVNDNEIRVKNSLLLDYEIDPQYTITVIATDMGAPPL